MKRFKVVFVAAALTALALGPALAAPEVFTIDPVHSQVGFTIRHIVSRVPGRFDTFSGEITVDRENLATSKVSAEIDCGSINTGNPKRDGHLKSPDFFNAEKNPKITFVSTNATASSKERLSLTGNLTMAGVTKPVTLDVKILGFAADPMGPGGQRAGFEAKTTLNRKDFGISWNRMLDAGGTILGDEVEITLLVEAAAAAPSPKPAGEAKPSGK